MTFLEWFIAFALVAVAAFAIVIFIDWCRESPKEEDEDDCGGGV